MGCVKEARKVRGGVCANEAREAKQDSASVSIVLPALPQTGCGVPEN